MSERIQANYQLPSWATRDHANTIITACGGQLLAFETLPNGNKDVLVQFESPNALAALTADLGYGPISTTHGNVGEPRTLTIVMLTASGLSRVSNGQVGMTFMVDSFGGVDNKCAHVRDYRYGKDGLRGPFQIWTLGFGDYQIIRSQP